MPLATRADLEAVRGPRRVRELLISARDRSTDPDAQAAQEKARLDEALAAGDDLIAQFLPLPSGPEHPGFRVLRRLAIGESLYFLECNIENGASEAADEQAKQRRRDLKGMRDRNQWPGTAEGQSNQVSGYVTNADSWSRRKMRGFK